MNGEELYDELKRAIKFFGLPFHHMGLITVAIEGDKILFSYGGREVTVTVNTGAA